MIVYGDDPQVKDQMAEAMTEALGLWPDRFLSDWGRSGGKCRSESRRDHFQGKVKYWIKLLKLLVI